MISKDALDRDVHVGDQVAYITRRSSLISVTKREVTWIYTLTGFLQLDGGTGKVNPRNVVNLSYDGVGNWPKWKVDKVRKSHDPYNSFR